MTGEVEFRRVEVREKKGELRGVILQEGRAASGGRREVFAPGSATWPAEGVTIRAQHRGDFETRTLPTRDKRGRIHVRAKATDGILDAIRAGKRYMSVEISRARRANHQGRRA